MKIRRSSTFEGGGGSPWHLTFCLLLILDCLLFSQINIENVEDLDSIYEELLGMPLLLRIWAEHVVQSEGGENSTKWEGKDYKYICQFCIAKGCILIGTLIKPHVVRRK